MLFMERKNHLNSTFLHTNEQSHVRGILKAERKRGKKRQTVHR